MAGRAYCAGRALNDSEVRSWPRYSGAQENSPGLCLILEFPGRSRLITAQRSAYAANQLLLASVNQHKQQIQYADHVHGQLRIEDRNGLALSAVKTLMLVSAGPGHYYDKSCCGDGRRRRIPYSTLVKRKKWSR